MAEYCLTAEEVLYLAAVTGADNMYGVPDTLSGISDQELRLKVVDMENSLVMKKYMEEDFDGNSSVLPELAQMIGQCGSCERFLSFETEPVGKAKIANMYFMSGDTAYKMICGEDTYRFSRVGFAEIRKEVEQSLELKEAKNKEGGVFRIPYDDLEKAVTLAKRGADTRAVELLRNAGAAEFAAQEIINGALNKIDYFALLFMDLRDDNTPGYSLQYLSGDALTVIEYETDGEETQDYVKFLMIDDAQLKQKLESGFDKIDCKKEAESFS